MIDWLILLILIAGSATFSGLTIGYLSLNKTDLERKMNLNNLHAKRVFEIRKDVNLLICSLLLGNVAINIAIPLYLDILLNTAVEQVIIPNLSAISVHPYILKFLNSTLISGVISTTLILLFGEIIPQAVTAKHALRVGAFFTPMMKLVILLFYPIAKPLSMILNFFLGVEEDTIFNRRELIEIIKQHEDHNLSSIDEDEERIILGALEFSKKTAGELMSPKRTIFMLGKDQELDLELLNRIKESGYTRIPVYQESRDNVIGILYAKDLIVLNPLDKVKIETIMRKDKLFHTKTDDKLDNLLEKMIKRFHMALVYDRFNTLVGLITLEDITETILKVKIFDESDKIPEEDKIGNINQEIAKNIELPGKDKE